MRPSPRLAVYMAAHQLKRRNIAGRYQAGWYPTIDRVTHSLLTRAKPYFPDMKLQAHPVLDCVPPTASQPVPRDVGRLGP